MRLKLSKLIAISQIYPPKSIDFKSKNTLIQGSSDTGKSYILDCIYFCLGGTDSPKDIGFSNSYTTFLLSFELNSTKYTIIRDYSLKIDQIYEGEFNSNHIDPKYKIKDKFNDFFISRLNLNTNKILKSSGVLSNVTLSGLKFFSFFNEDKTLSSDYLIPAKVKNQITERKSLFSLILSGSDDKNIELPASTLEKSKIDGKILAYKSELETIDAWFKQNDIERKSDITDIDLQIEKLDLSIDNQLEIRAINQEKINKLIYELVDLREQEQSISLEIIEIEDNLFNFNTLIDKYESDQERLIAILNTNAVFNSFADHNCPTCNSIIKVEDNNFIQDITQSITFEINKIYSLKNQLIKLIHELRINLKFQKTEYEIIKNKISLNIRYQHEIKNLFNIGEFKELSQKKNSLSNSIFFTERFVKLNTLIEDNTAVKIKKVKIERQLSTHFSSISNSCISLLKEWGVENIINIFISDENMDLMINQRERTSYGKGKKAIFLAAYAISVMQHALKNGYPHLGFIIIDSPLVTHKDRKYGFNTLNTDKEKIQEQGDYTSISVAHKCYRWLSNYQGLGQIIIIENDSPPDDIDLKLNYIEFTGNSDIGRRGFY